ncbi:START domain-containing protein [Pseudoalteromonas sp. DL2-H2.2]|uniref:START domain-containing protein n=1 Tax=Pseudoalteromonas sp. DL2-H2.2 TaxID=2908889 RepID=UPI001F219A8E|nr:START domain-containing protein [Pseudoalteromonas sp. DL2-H2.2]MCF2910628.1 START domain-containing protein [Pseudoalteromonas sp. DL2-H2.2]
MNLTGNLQRLTCLCILFWLVGYTAPGHTVQAPENWQSWHHGELFSVAYQKRADQPLKIRVTGQWPGISAKSVINLLNDIDSVPLWVKHVSTVAILSRPAPNQTRVLTHFDLPWPLRKRDMLTHACLLHVSKASYLLKIRSVAEPAPAPGVIRIEPVTVQWRLTERDNAVEIDYQISADLQGGVPQWFVDKVALRNTRASFNALHDLLQARVASPQPWALIPGNTCPF